MSQNPEIWRSDNYRQNVRTRLDEVFKQLNAPTAYSGPEIEQKIYDKTLQTGATKEIYHGLLKKITMQIHQSFQNIQARQVQQQSELETSSRARQTQQEHYMQQVQPQMSQQQPQSGDQTSADFWMSDAFRQNVRTRLDEVFKQLNAPAQYTGREIEQKIYDKTMQTGATKDVYHGLLKKITLQIQALFEKKQRETQQEMQLLLQQLEPDMEKH